MFGGEDAFEIIIYNDLSCVQESLNTDTCVHMQCVKPEWKILPVSYPRSASLFSSCLLKLETENDHICVYITELGYIFTIAEFGLHWKEISRQCDLTGPSGAQHPSCHLFLSLSLSVSLCLSPSRYSSCRRALSVIRYSFDASKWKWWGHSRGCHGI